MEKKKGKLIAIEGIDGSGKSTITSMLCDILRTKGFVVKKFVNSSGGTSNYWQTILSIKRELKGTALETPAEIEQAFHTMEFLEYCRYSLPQKLQECDFVFADRYALGKMLISELITQKQDSWSSKLLEQQLNSGSIPQPDMTFYLQTDPNEAFRRIIKRGQSLEDKEHPEMLKKAVFLFNKLLHKNANIFAIPTNQGPMATCEEIIRHIKPQRIQKKNLVITLDNNSKERS